MMDISIEKLDNLFLSYNYSLSSRSTKELRIYTLRYGMYYAAELVKLNENVDVTFEKKEFSDLGYATEVKNFSSEKEIEEYLFEGFFIKTPLGNELKKRYKQFENKQLRNLPEDSNYQYIDSSFNILLQNDEGAILESKNFPNRNSTLISTINDLLLNTSGSIFIIIEAPAGFGKTCTAYEILNNFSADESKKLPFFSELSRNREARIFKHILLNEIDEQFPIGIKKNIVIDQITKGRIPLIIDGFDELITKESSKEEVESMLTTIVELLKGNAKVIVTTRKTALFSSEEFFNSVDISSNNFSIARIEIKEPTLKNWLSKDRLDIIKSKNFPLAYVENPVLLSYLRNISKEKFNMYFSKDSEESIVEKYIDYLLKREQIRQNIKLTTDKQLGVFRKLVRLMTEFGFTTESKETIKDFIKEYNQKDLKESLNEYIPEEKPSLEDLVETISNHVFLDRKQGGKIGIINDFIFGLLIAENLIKGEFEKYYPNYYDILPEDFAIKAIQSFKIQTNESKLKLWNVFNDEKFQLKYNTQFYFNLDYFFKKKFDRNYNNLVIDDWILEDVLFKNSTFNQSVFSNVVFKKCFFDLNVFQNCTFQNCEFYNCSLFPVDCKKHFNDFATFACSDDNGFLDKISERIECSKYDKIVLYDHEILKIFFHNKKEKPVPRKISYLKSILSEYPPDQINKKINMLKQNQYTYFNNEYCFISKKGVDYFKKINDSLI